MLLALSRVGIHINTCLLYGLNTSSGLVSRGKTHVPSLLPGPALKDQEDRGGSGQTSQQ